MLDRKKTFKNLAVVLGIVLIIGALVLFVVDIINKNRSIDDNKEVLEFLDGILPEKTLGIKEELSNVSMPAVSYNGRDYIAIIEVPRFSVKLPVKSEWDKYSVNSVPCGYTGSCYDGSLVIGGSDIEGQFDFLPEIDIGDEINVTDMRGRLFSYRVEKVKHANDSKTSTLVDQDYDLALFVKDRSSGDWIIARCNMK